MTSVTARHRGMAERIWMRFSDGRTVTLRKLSSLANPAAAPPVTGLQVRGVTAAGASTIDIDASTLRGTLPWGATFTIAGVAGTFTTTGAKTAAANILEDVPFTPVLPVGGAADNAAVTITQAYGEFTFRALRTRFEDEDKVDSAFIAKDWQKYHFLTHADGVAPEVGDLVYDGADTDYVVRVRPVAPAGAVSRWIVFTGRSPGGG